MLASSSTTAAAASSCMTTAVLAAVTQPAMPLLVSPLLLVKQLCQAACTASNFATTIVSSDR
jgi:type IV secretory pathway VirB3-like protein